MQEFVESSVRRLVAGHLGVSAEELVGDVSLRDDLAADSLDLVELAMALEKEFSIEVPERMLDQVRTYADLVRATGLLIRAGGETRVRGAEPALRIWARLVPPAGASSGDLGRAGWLTADAAETIAEESLRAGRGTRLELTVAAGTDDVALACMQHQFAWLAERGVQVTVRRDDGLAPPLHFTASHAVTAQRIAEGPRLAFTHRLLDQLTGTPTTVTIGDYLGDDPWQADDLIASVDAGAKRFGDGTPLEQAEALSGNGPCRFVDGVPSGLGHRATTAGHHAHVDQPHDPAVNAARDFINKKPTQLEIGPGGRSARSYQTDLCTELRPGGELQTWREATCYSQDGDGRSFGISSSMTRLTPTGHPAGPQQGLHARFHLSAPSANDFRPLTVRLCGADRGGICTLLIQVFARIAGREQFAQVTLRGIGSTMDVRLLPPAAAREAGLLAS